MQSHHTVAFVLGNEMLCVVARQGIGGVVPGIAVATRCFKVAINSVIDDEMQSDHRVATMDVLQCLGVITRLVIDGIVP